MKINGKMFNKQPPGKLLHLRLNILLHLIKEKKT